MRLAESFKSELFMKHKKILSSIRSKGMLTQTPSKWAYMMLQKLSYVHFVSNCINFKSRFTGNVEDSDDLYKAHQCKFVLERNIGIQTNNVEEHQKFFLRTQNRISNKTGKSK